MISQIILKKLSIGEKVVNIKPLPNILKKIKGIFNNHNKKIKTIIVKTKLSTCSWLFLPLNKLLIQLTILLTNSFILTSKLVFDSFFI